MIRREKKSEAIDGIKRRMTAISSEAGNLVSWKFVSIDVNQLEVYEEFADAQAVKAFKGRRKRQQVNVKQNADIARALQPWTCVSTQTWMN